MNLPVPAPPRWSVAWEELVAACPLLRALEGCPQDPAWHPEGDVLAHTRLVVEALASSDGFRALPEAERRVVFLAALLHDAGKPACTRTTGEGRVESPGHSRKGALLAREWMYRAWFEPAEREAVCGLVRHHQLAFHVLDREDPPRAAFRAAAGCRCDHLALLGQADALGRTSGEVAKLLESVALFADLCREEGCLTGPREFPSPHSRFLYFRTPGRNPLHEAFDDTGCEAVLLSGLPASGKSTFARSALGGLPVISLDGLRADLGVEPEDAQGPVVERARELAREHLRAARSLVLDATCISREIRSRWVDLFAAYGARVRMVHVEAPLEQLVARNRRRAVPVPARILDRLLERWEPPDLTEAHAVERVFPLQGA